jgi:hypothetical protein
MKRKPKQKIVVDAIFLKEANGEVSASVPPSVLRNSTLVNKELSMHSVDKLSYQYDAEVFGRICRAYNFTDDWYDRLKELIELNSGYITPHLLRAHFGVSWATCSRLTDSLIAERQACLAPDQREQYLLPGDMRKGGWLEPVHE